MRKNIILGALLIGIGLLLLLGQFGLFSGHFVLYLISFGFFTVYILLGGNTRNSNVGFLIPASILLAIALFVDIERLINKWPFGPGWFFILLSGAFFSVYLIHTRYGENQHENKKWPIYPGTALGLFGIFIAIIEQFETLKRFEIFNIIFPLVIIAVGLYLILRKDRNKQGNKN